MTSKFHEFRALLSEEEMNQLAEIKKQNVELKNNHDVMKFLLNQKNSKIENEIQELRNLKAEQATTNEILGELSMRAKGFTNALNDVPLTDIENGIDAPLVKAAKKKVLERIDRASKVKADKGK